MFDCYFKKYFQVECPGCGIQRAFHSFLKGDFLASFQFNAALFPLLITIILLLFQLIFKTKNGGFAVAFSFAITALTMFIQLIAKWII